MEILNMKNEKKYYLTNYTIYGVDSNGETHNLGHENNKRRFFKLLRELGNTPNDIWTFNVDIDGLYIDENMNDHEERVATVTLTRKQVRQSYFNEGKVVLQNMFKECI